MGRAPQAPQRTCIACRQVGAKAGLLRVVRTPQGEVRLDETGKLAGRGAYLCRQARCLEQALKQKKVGRALGVPIGDDAIAELRQRMAQLAGPESHEEVKRAEHESS